MFPIILLIIMAASVAIGVIIYFIISVNSYKSCPKEESERKEKCKRDMETAKIILFVMLFLAVAIVWLFSSDFLMM